MSKNEYRYFKLVKLSPAGEKIGYYNSGISPDDSWPTTNVDEAQILTADEVKGVMLIHKFMQQICNTQDTIQKIGIY